MIGNYFTVFLLLSYVHVTLSYNEFKETITLHCLHPGECQYESTYRISPTVKA